MVEVYVERILKGVITIDKVPARWRAAVEARLEELNPKQDEMKVQEEDNDNE